MRLPDYYSICIISQKKNKYHISDICYELIVKKGDETTTKSMNRL